MTQYIHNLVEIRSFGWNLLTCAFIGTIVLSLVQVWGIVGQIEKINRTQSITSISVPFVRYFTIHFLCLGIYGFKHNLLAYMLSGVLLGIMYIMTLDTAINHGATVEMPNYLVYMVGSGATMYIAPAPYDFWLMTICYCAGTYAICLIPYEIWDKKGQGAVSIKLLVTISMTVAFWAAYGTFIRDWMLVITCLVSLIALSIAVYLCLVNWLGEAASSDESA